MKQISIIIALFLFPLVLQAQQRDSEENFYYYSGEKIILTEQPNKVLLKVSAKADKEKFFNRLQLDKSVKITGNTIGKQTKIPNFVFLESSDGKSISADVLKKCRDNTDIISVQLMLQYNTTQQGLTDEFVVKLKPSVSYEQLLDRVKEYNCTVVEENRFVKNQFMLSVSKDSKLNALQTANRFYETGLFEFASPNFVLTNIFHSIDTYFTNQWGLKNTGQNGGTAGVDIKIEDAWNITQGEPSIKVAVVDNGVDLTHPDLAANLVAGYDATGYGTGGAPIPVANEFHGTACAGIIAAKKDNGIGVAGIAPRCKIAPVHVTFGVSIIDSLGEVITSDDWLADGINWAWQNGADVISNSWGGGSPSDAITTAINSATNIGRNGKGCIVAFSAGNNNSPNVSSVLPDSSYYPASLPNVIAVGAISPCGERKRSSSNPLEVGLGVLPDSLGVSCDGEVTWGSNYGDALDIMAPGVLVPTTDIQDSVGYSPNNYTMTFNGTSAACLHVAGVAALMLSVNPNLEWTDVAAIIDSTAQKVGGYTYQATAWHPHGTWNQEMGYGLINAYAALQAVRATLPPPCTDTTEMIDENVVIDDIAIEDCIVNVHNVNVGNNKDLTIRAETAINISGYFNVSAGSVLELTPIP